MKIKKINVRNFIENLKENELKNVVAGYSASGGNWCYWESPTDSGCATDSVSAEFMSCGGFWCCNCSDPTAMSRCSS